MEIETVEVTASVTNEPTCTEKGETTYTSASFTADGFAIQTKTEADIDPAGHTWGEAAYTWSEDNTRVTAEHVCSKDPSHVESDTVAATVSMINEPTCTEKGEAEYTSAAFMNIAFEIQTKTADADPTGHSWGEYVRPVPIGADSDELSRGEQDRMPTG